MTDTKTPAPVPYLACPHCGNTELRSDELCTIGYPATFTAEGPVYTGGSTETFDDPSKFADSIACRSCGAVDMTLDDLVLARVLADGEHDGQDGRPCGACGAEIGEACRPMCLGQAEHDRVLADDRPCPCGISHTASEHGAELAQPEVAGPRIAYYLDETMTTVPAGGWVPAVVEEGDYGYTPVSYGWHGITFAQALERVASMNGELGLTPDDVAAIVVSSFRPA